LTATGRMAGREWRFRMARFSAGQLTNDVINEDSSGDSPERTAPSAAQREFGTLGSDSIDGPDHAISENYSLLNFPSR
ncbi:MAG: hypothetical protein WCA98_00550, partial [Candidatus Acidiferrales bacterium]